MLTVSNARLKYKNAFIISILSMTSTTELNRAGSQLCLFLKLQYCFQISLLFSKLLVYYYFQYFFNCWQYINRSKMFSLERVFRCRNYDGYLKMIRYHLIILNSQYATQIFWWPYPYLLNFAIYWVKIFSVWWFYLTFLNLIV